MGDNHNELNVDFKLPFDESLCQTMEYGYHDVPEVKLLFCLIQCCRICKHSCNADLYDHITEKRPGYDILKKLSLFNTTFYKVVTECCRVYSPEKTEQKAKNNTTPKVSVSSLDITKFEKRIDAIGL